MERIYSHRRGKISCSSIIELFHTCNIDISMGSVRVTRHGTCVLNCRRQDQPTFSRRYHLLSHSRLFQKYNYSQYINGVFFAGKISWKQSRPVSLKSVSLFSRGQEDVWMVICIAAAITQYLERRTRLGSYLSGPFVAICIGLVGSGALSVLPFASPVYDAVSSRLLPLGVAMYVLEVDISNILSKKSSTMLAAFCIGALATCVGTWLSFLMFASRMGMDAVNISSALCASYIGGSVNFAAVIAALGTKLPETVATAMSADNLMMGFYLACLMFLSQKGSTGTHIDGGYRIEGPVSSESISYSMATAFISTRCAWLLAANMGYPSLALALVSIVAGLLSPIISKTLHTNTATLFAGSTSLASFCMTLFFCAMGAQAGHLPLLNGTAGYLFAFIFVQLAVQLSISLVAGRVLKIPLDVMLIACNANVGGAATAVAMCISKKWNHLLQPALLVASLGYIIGNPIGLAMAKLLAQI